MQYGMEDTKVNAKTAHITKTVDKIFEQDLKEHLLHTAILCRGYMGKAGCPGMGYLAGILHDAGKAGPAFQGRMEAIREGRPDPGQKGGHASAGAVLLGRLSQKLDHCSKRTDNCYKSFALQAVCEAIFSHHAALPDNISPQLEDGYKARLQCEEDELAEIEAYFLGEIISRECFEKLLEQACGEAEAFVKSMRRCARARKEMDFFLGMAEKMLLSALIDADWLDSATCGGQGQTDFEDLVKEEFSPRYGENSVNMSREQLFTHFLGNLENGLREMNQSAKPINTWRNYISDQCKEAGARKGGIYTLSCPTGAGKTLAVTRFALTHCIQQGKERIFYIIPYLSVIDQTAKSIKKALGAKNSGDTDELVESGILELHSQAEYKKGGKTPGNSLAGEEEPATEGDFWAQRMAEAIVLTTMVRFLNTFFARGTRNLRPAHQFQNAVLIFDEVQTLPIKQIALFNSLINYLTQLCGCTCVLCTATQPLLGETVKPVYPAKMAEPAALAELPPEAGEVFRRVRIEPRLKTAGYTQKELADFVWEKAEESGNALVILNTRDCALAVYSEVVKQAGEAYKVYYLSTKLYAAHRKSIIDEIRRALKAGEKIMVISTSLIEAGIDFDFSCVIRSLAGKDSIVQAAGRCNREGLRGVEPTYIVNPCRELESLVRLRDIRVGAASSERLLAELARDRTRFGGELLSEEAIHIYFSYYFWERAEEMVYPISRESGGSLYNLLSDNMGLVKSGHLHNAYEVKLLNQAFKTAAEHFSVIEEKGNSVFVPRGRGKEIWAEIQRNAKPGKTEYKYIKSLLKEAQQYVVNLHNYEIEKLGKGAIQWEDNMGMYVLNEMYYDEKAGITGEISSNMPIQMF